MKRIYPILIVLFAGAVISALAALYVLRPPAEASGPIEAVPLGVVATESVEAATDVIETAQETAVDTVPETVTGDASAAAETEAASPIEEIAEPAAETANNGGLIIYQISSADSQVTFELDEDLRGNRVTVVGTTNQVAGELAVDFNDLSQTQVGVIQINARTLATDNSNRNRAMQNEILDTGSYEYITFVPTAVTGLPESVNIGDAITFTIEGNLTIRNVTLPASFTVEATAVSDTQIVGTASAIVTRSDYGLTIPSVPNVANVEEEVELYIDFVANATS
jgi:polyisoprenoid-binding protein YceI